ncbi:MAG: L,D-transpeptidase family protein [Tepidisphaerales bacterium]
MRWRCAWCVAAMLLTAGWTDDARSLPVGGESRDVRLRHAVVQQVLAEVGFSPGLIDGRPGRRTRLAIESFQRARGLPPTGDMDGRTWEALLEARGGVKRGFEPLRYRITDADAAQITGPIPNDWNERARLSFSGFADLEELLAERGWCTREFLRYLNPGVNFARLQTGDEVLLPRLDPVRLPAISRLEIDLTEKLVRGFDADGRHVLLLHCSIAREVEKRPVGSLRVTVVATDPNYTFNPESWPEVKNVTRRLIIAPGPRNPVGLAWIGLDRPGYGLHGTPRPEDIGKTGSHGCFRLTNWDAVRLARAVRIGTEVVVRD